MSVLFIGGPADGRREELPEDAHVWVVSELNPFPLLLPENTPMILHSSIQEHHYKIHCFMISDSVFRIAAHEKLSEAHALAMLLSKYPPEMGEDLNGG